MATRWLAPHLRGLENRDDAWDLVVKVEYKGTLKRFNARGNGSYFDHNLTSLRSNIASAFKFSSDLEFILTYTDEDGDVVMLDDENDLRDAAINQKLNPLRINVQLKNSNTEALGTKHQASNSRSPRSTALEDQLAQVKSDIDEAMKFVPEQVPAVLAKLSHDLHSKAASSIPSLAELLDRLATLMTPKGNICTTSGSVYGSSCSSGGPQASRNTKVEQENELMIGSASLSPKMQNAPGLKSVQPEDRKAQVEQRPVYHSVDSLNFVGSGGKKFDHKGSTVTESKLRCASQSKEKSTTSSAVPPVSSSTYAATPIQHTTAPSVGEKKLRYSTYGHNSLISGDLQPRGGLSASPPNFRPLGSSGNINSYWQPCFSPPTNMYGLPKLDMPSSVGTYVPAYKYDVAPSASNIPEGRYSFGHSCSYGSIPQRAVHRWIQCDVCRVTPIVGPRYKSNVKDNYDLCGACFSHVGDESEYTRLDKPTSVNLNNRKLLERLQRQELKLECSFISDITIPDGTSMAPANPFTKIWRLRNSGSTVWPFGTQVIWVGGDRFAIESSVKLEISVSGVAGGQEVDVAVAFVAPAKPGRYISYWRLALPSGKQFGQQIWVHIQVEEPTQTSGNKLSAAINLNLPPGMNSFIDNMNIESMNPFFQYPLNIYNEMPQPYDTVVPLESESEHSPTAPNFQSPNYGQMSSRFYQKTVIPKESEAEPDAPAALNTYPSYSKMFGFQAAVIPKESEPALSALPSTPVSVKQVQIPTTDHHASFTGSASKSIAALVPPPVSIPLPKSVSFAIPVSAPFVSAPASLPALTPASVPTAVGHSFAGPVSTSIAAVVPPPETIPLPKSVTFAAPVSASSVPAPASLPAHTPGIVPITVLPDETVNHKEEKLLRGLEEDLEPYIHDFSDLDDWDPLFGELSELGFNDAEMNKKAVAEAAGGSIKEGLVMNLVARAKKGAVMEGLSAQASSSN